MDDAPAAMRTWIERNVGGRITRVERQARWRPAWDIDVERDGDTLPVYFRGDRGSLDHGVYGLEHELAVLQVLEAHGIPVPHVYGFCPEPRGIVMARVPGRANLLTATTDDDPPAVLDDYMGWLARIHAIGTEPFERAGLAQEPGPAALADLDRWERTYRRLKVRPEPLIEFVLRWLRRNVPDRDVASTLAVGDSGQFLYAGAHITAVIDLELAFLGDPLHDLACMRLRDLAEPLGDLNRGFATYERVAGARIDRRALDYHTVRFAICTPMSTAHVLARPPAEIDLVRYLVWYVQFSRVALEILASLLDVALEPIDDVAPTVGRFGAAPAMLASALDDLAPTEPLQQFRLDVARRTNELSRQLLERGPALDAQDLDEAASLLGRRPGSWQECDAALESFVASAGPGQDAALVRLFHRRAERWQTMLDAGMQGRRRSPAPLTLDR
jgi:aminoglycoside phosphotransferase (APT) family kinase protein